MANMGAGVLQFPVSEKYAPQTIEGIAGYALLLVVHQSIWANASLKAPTHLCGNAVRR